MNKGLIVAAIAIAGCSRAPRISAPTSDAQWSELKAACGGEHRWQLSRISVESFDDNRIICSVYYDTLGETTPDEHFFKRIAIENYPDLTVASGEEVNARVLVARVTNFSQGDQVYEQYYCSNSLPPPLPPVR